MRKIWFHKTVGKFIRDLKKEKNEHKKIIIERWKSLALVESIDEVPGLIKVEGPSNFYKFYMDDADIPDLGPTEAYEHFVLVTSDTFAITHIDFLVQAPKLII